ncbi:MAG: methyltransferase domain-containing protein [Candidatus Thorarchaeota archaeon]
MSEHKAVLAMPREEIREDYIERLAEFWPEPREQLHFGGWTATLELVEKLQLDKGEYLLDLCCGEGGTACWLAKEHGRRVAGIDILEKAIEAANRCSEEKGVADRTDFRVADVFELPFSDSTFDIIYGLDPDGIAHQDRVEIFRECKRVLQIGGKMGFQHWLIQSDAAPEDIEHFEETTAGTGYPYMKRLTVKDYLDDLRDAGFKDFMIEDLSEMYHKHTLKIKERVKELNIELDSWHSMLLDLCGKGVKIGARILASTE